MTTVGVVGRGYVGLPLAVEFGKKFQTIGYDLSTDKVKHYRNHIDPTREVSIDELRAHMSARAGTRRFVFVAVPTSIDGTHLPDFNPLVAASDTVGRHMKQGATWCTNRRCIPERPRRYACPCLRSTRA